MARLFEGFAGAHGTHGDVSKNDEKGGKLEIKRTARTVREPVTLDLWRQHLEGERALGIIPIREDSSCRWGCIDVDKYDLDLVDTARRLKELGLPLVPCRSKSGGCHVFLFLLEPVPAVQMQSFLKQLAANLGWGDCEIFPKQTRILGDKGDLGNWLNMPYFGGDKTDRYAIKDTIGGYALREFLNHAESMRVHLEDLSLPKEQKDESLSDGPPCLQHLTAVGFPPGQGNNGFFALAIFCKRKFGTNWRKKAEEYNHKFFNPPRPADEVAEALKRIDSKEYEYSCNNQPLSSYCNAPLCRTRKFGVGGGGLYPVISGMSKLESDPPLWFVDIEGERVELSTDDLADYRRFQKICMNRLTTTFLPMGAKEWLAMVGDAMSTAVRLEAPVDASLSGHFMELLEEFLTNRHAGTAIEDLFLGKPWEDPSTGRHYFRLRDLMDFLKRENFVIWGRNTVSQRIRELGGSHYFNVKGKGVHAMFVEQNYLSENPDLALPKSKGSPI